MTAPTADRRRVFGDDHDAFRDSVRRYLQAEVVPNADAWTTAGIPRGVFAAAAELGFLGTTVPEEFGGGGIEDSGFLAVLVEEAVYAGASNLALLWALQGGVAAPQLVRAGTSEQQQRWLPGLASGQLVAIPGPAALRSVAGAQLADVIITAHEGGSRLLAVDQPGVSVHPVPGVLAGADAGVGDVTVHDARWEAMGQPVPMQADLDIWFAVLAVAGARQALSLTVDYVGSRKVFGKAIGEFENTRFRLTELAAEVTMATAFVDSCLAAHSLGSLRGVDAAAARLCASSLHDRVVDQGLQFHGGYGYIREYPISRAFAHARFLRLVAAGHSDPRQTLASGMDL